MRARSIELATDFAKLHHAQGKAEGEAKSILAVLAARRIEVTPDQRTAIERCTDVGQLDEWLRRAATADSAGVDDDLVRDVTEMLTSLCARLYGRRAAASRAARGIAVITGDAP